MTVPTSGCASKRLLRVENILLHQQQDELLDEVVELRRRAPAPSDFTHEPNLDIVKQYLASGGITAEMADDAGDTDKQ